MSSSIEKRVVKMEFDNSKFESGVKTSMSTLQKLKNALNLSGSGKGAKLAMAEVQNSVNGLNFSGVESGVSSLQRRFSTLGVIGMTAISNITNSVVNLGKKLISQALQGGITRAMNIEQAKFMIEGLGKDYVKLSEDINYAVEDTAYGFDEAAKAAAQFSASGIEAGDDMKAALRGISGVAAMTSSSYTDIADVFTKVAGQGRVMGDDLLRLSSRGINAAAILADQMGKTEQEVRDMVSKGKISFEDFSKAMDDAFGEHAKEANRTFTGSLSNVKAALSRIGAGFVTPLIETKDEYQSTLKAITDISGESEEAIDKYLSALKTNGKVTAENLQELSKKGVDATKILARYLDKTEEEIIDMANKGELSFKQLSTAMDWAFGSKNFIDVLNSFKGMLNALKKEMENTGIYEAWGKAINKISNYLSAFFDAVAKAHGMGFDDIKETFADLFSVDISYISDIMGGVSSAINIVKTAFTTLFNAVKPAGSAFSSFKEAIFSVLAAIGRFITKIDELVQKTGVLETIGKIITSIFTGASNVISSVFNALKNGLNSIRGDSSKNIEKTGDTLSKFLDKLDGFSKISDKVSAAFDAIGRALTSFFNAIGNAFSGGGANGIVALLNGSLITTLLLNLRKSKKSLDETLGNLSFLDFIKKIGEIPDKIGEIIDAITENLATMDKQIKSKAILNIALAIGVLAISLKLLSTVDADEAGRALMSLGGAIGGLYLTMKLMTGLLATSDKKNPTKGLTKLAASMLVFSVAILILAAALKILSKVEPDRLIPSLAALVVMMVSLAKITGLIDKEAKDLTKAAASFILMGVALLIFSSAVRKLGSLDLMTLSKGMLSAIVALLVFAKIPGLIDKKAENLVKAAASFILMGVALRVFATAVEKLGSLDLMTLSKGMLAAIVALLVLAKIPGLMGKDTKFIKAAVAIAIMAASLKLLVKPIKQLGKMDFVELAVGLGALLVALVAFAGIAKVANGTLLGATAILVMAGAVRVLAPALERLGKMSLKEIGKSLLVLAGAFAIFLAAGLIAEVVAPGLIILGAAVAMLGAGMALAGVGVLAFATGLSALAASAAVIVASMSTIVLAIITFIEEFALALKEKGPVIADAVWTLIQDLLDGMLEALPEIIETASEIIRVVLTTIRDNIGEIVDLGIDIVLGLIDGINQRMPELVDAAFSLVITLLNSLADAIRENGELVGEALWNLVSALIDGAIGLIVGFFSSPFDALSEGARMEQDAMLAMIDEGQADGVRIVEGYQSSYENAGKGLSAGLSRGIKSGTDNVPKNVNTAVTKGKKESDNQKGGYTSSGKNLMLGMSEGINSGSPSLISSVRSAATTALQKMKEDLGIQSPSRETMKIGRFFDMGFAVGVSKYSGTIEDSVSNLSDDTINSLSRAFANVADTIQNEVDLQPRIRPVLDLSDIRSGAQSLGAMFNGQYISLGSAVDNFANVNMAMNAANALNSSQNKLLMEGQNHMVTTLDELLTNSERSALDVDRVYEAIREGAENATIRLSLNGRELSRGLKELGVAFK